MANEEKADIQKSLQDDIIEDIYNKLILWTLIGGFKSKENDICKGGSVHTTGPYELCKDCMKELNRFLFGKGN